MDIVQMDMSINKKWLVNQLELFEKPLFCNNVRESAQPHMM
jgi:hypothetical protein